MQNNIIIITLEAWGFALLESLVMVALILLGETYNEWRGKKKKTPEEIAEEFLNKYK